MFRRLVEEGGPPDGKPHVRPSTRNVESLPKVPRWTSLRLEEARRESYRSRGRGIHASSEAS